MNLSEDGTMICVGPLSQLREKNRHLSSSVTSSKIGKKVKEKRKRKKGKRREEKGKRDHRCERGMFHADVSAPGDDVTPLAAHLALSAGL